MIWIDLIVYYDNHAWVWYCCLGESMLLRRPQAKPKVKAKSKAKSQSRKGPREFCWHHVGYSLQVRNITKYIHGTCPWNSVEKQGGSLHVSLVPWHGPKVSFLVPQGASPTVRTVVKRPAKAKAADNRMSLVRIIFRFMILMGVILHLPVND